VKQIVTLFNKNCNALGEDVIQGRGNKYLHAATMALPYKSAVYAACNIIQQRNLAYFNPRKYYQKQVWQVSWLAAFYPFFSHRYGAMNIAWIKLYAAYSCGTAHDLHMVPF
jgi:hypothetical protein